ncbi:hypothetical protein P9112_006644 [Eukaryota sp. TZLM1-RC]
MFEHIIQRISSAFSNYNAVVLLGSGDHTSIMNAFASTPDDSSKVHFLDLTLPFSTLFGSPSLSSGIFANSNDLFSSLLSNLDHELSHYFVFTGEVTNVVLRRLLPTIRHQIFQVAGSGRRIYLPRNSYFLFSSPCYFTDDFCYLNVEGEPSKKEEFTEVERYIKVGESIQESFKEKFGSDISGFSHFFKRILTLFDPPNEHLLSVFCYSIKLYFSSLPIKSNQLDWLSTRLSVVINHEFKDDVTSEVVFNYPMQFPSISELSGPIFDLVSHHFEGLLLNEFAKPLQQYVICSILSIANAITTNQITSLIGCDDSLIEIAYQFIGANEKVAPENDLFSQFKQLIVASCLENKWIMVDLNHSYALVTNQLGCIPSSISELFTSDELIGLLSTTFSEIKDLEQLSSLLSRHKVRIVLTVSSSMATPHCSHTFAKFCGLNYSISESISQYLSSFKLDQNCLNHFSNYLNTKLPIFQLLNQLKFVPSIIEDLKGNLDSKLTSKIYLISSSMDYYNTCQANLNELQMQLAQYEEDVAKKETDYDSVNQSVVEIDQSIDSIRSTVNEIQSNLESKTSAAQELDSQILSITTTNQSSYAKSIKSIQTLSEDDFDELRCIDRPSINCQLVSEAISHLFNLGQDWITVRKFVCKKGFATKIESFEKDSLSESDLEFLQKLVSRSEFDTNQMTSSVVIKMIGDWVVSLVKVHESNKDILPLKTELGKLKDDLEVINKELSQHQQELEGLEGQKDEFLTDRHVIKSELDQLWKKIKDGKRSGKKFEDLLSNFEPVFQTFEKRSSELMELSQNLDLLSCFIVMSSLVIFSSTSAFSIFSLHIDNNLLVQFCEFFSFDFPLNCTNIVLNSLETVFSVFRDGFILVDELSKFKTILKDFSVEAQPNSVFVIDEFTSKYPMLKSDNFPHHYLDELVCKSKEPVLYAQLQTLQDEIKESQGKYYEIESEILDIFSSKSVVYNDNVMIRTLANLKVKQEEQKLQLDKLLEEKNQIKTQFGQYSDISKFLTTKFEYFNQTGTSLEFFLTIASDLLTQYISEDDLFSKISSFFENLTFPKSLHSVCYLEVPVVFYYKNDLELNNFISLMKEFNKANESQHQVKISTNLIDSGSKDAWTMIITKSRVANIDRKPNLFYLTQDFNFLPNSLLSNSFAVGCAKLLTFNHLLIRILHSIEPFLPPTPSINTIQLVFAMCSWYSSVFVTFDHYYWNLNDFSSLAPLFIGACENSLNFDNFDFNYLYYNAELLGRKLSSKDFEQFMKQFKLIFDSNLPAKIDEVFENWDLKQVKTIKILKSFLLSNFDRDFKAELSFLNQEEM